MNSRIDGYMLMNHLGSGAMGDVYQAINHRTGQMVAIKILHRLDQAARFAHEARVLQAIDHQHITKIHEYHVDHDKAYIVMEYVEGLTVAKLIDHQGKLPELFCHDVIRQLANTLSYLHSHGIIHRDIKASNIKITKDNKLKLLDFGIAKSKLASQLTAEGYVVGSAAFMAPEQFNNTITPKVDIWAMGILLYQMLTGHLPFSSNNELELRQKIEKGQYMNPEIFTPRLSRKMKRILRKMLRTNRNKRISNQDLIMLLDSNRASFFNLYSSNPKINIYA